MKKIVYTILLIFFILGCAKEKTVIVEVPVEVESNPDDIDGDGVTNQQETVDNTSPDNGCDYLQSSQFYPATSMKWRALDCDGDGVTNGDEIDPDGNGQNNNNGTNPKYECEFVLGDRTLAPGQQYLNGDCDGDGVPNGQEELDGTDINDYCDLVIASQTLEPEAFWFDLDCDEDCVSNEQEILDGTDPLDGNDFLGNGQTFSEYREVWSFAPEEIHYFDQDGNRLTQIVDSDGLLLSDYIYDGDNLISAQVRTTNGAIINLSYEYQGNQLSQITKNGMVRTIEYQGNSILSHDSDEPPGLYREKLTFDGAFDKLLTKERFYFDGSEWHYVLRNYNYDGAGMISSISSSEQGYDPSTGEYYVIDPDGFNTSYSSFTFSAVNSNVMYNATMKLKIPGLFDRELLSRLNQSMDANYAHFESMHLDRFSWATQYVDYSYGLRIDCSKTNDNPTRGVYLGQYGDVFADLIYFYE